MLQHNITDLVTRLGDTGIFVAMFLESSIVPIPSEVVIAGAAVAGIPIVSILIFGSLGSTLGAILGYGLGRYAALPVILKFGKFILIKPHHINKAEEFAKKYGSWSVLIGRILPIVPFKVFSIAAGITRIRLLPFILFTIIGVLPRIYILSIFGKTIVKYKMQAAMALCGLLLIFLVAKIMYRINRQNGSQNNCKDGVTGNK